MNIIHFIYGCPMNDVKKKITVKIPMKAESFSLKSDLLN